MVDDQLRIVAHKPSDEDSEGCGRDEEAAA
jgi:hypothetical protein